MPDKYIVNMTEKTAPEDTNLLVVEDAADTKKITFTNLFKPIKDMIGNLASLTTAHKSTLVGAINEVQANNSSLSAKFPQPHQILLDTPANQGNTSLYKSSTPSADYGTVLIDTRADGSSLRLMLIGRDLQLQYRDPGGAATTVTIGSV